MSYRHCDEAASEKCLSALTFVSRRWFRQHLPGPLLQLDSERASESPSGIVRLCTVVVHEDRVVPAIAEQRAAELPDLDWRLHPAGRSSLQRVLAGDGEHAPTDMK